MEGVEASSEEIERALMDLGPLLGVTVKEETPDESQTAAATDKDNAGVEGADSLDAPTLAEETRCELCRVLLMQADGVPRLMDCLHSLCQPCLAAKIETGGGGVSVMCPTCGMSSAAATMVEQRFVMEKMASNDVQNVAAGPQQCNSCEEREPATSYCVDCAEYICESCVLAHQRLKITKDHTIKSKDEAADASAAPNARPTNDLMCQQHPQERLSLFCETCSRLTCRDCQLQQHRDHKYQFSAEMAQQARAQISSLLSEVSYKRVLLGSAMKVIRDRQTLIADKKKALVREITNTVVKLTNAINSRGKALVLRLGEVCDAKQRTLKEKKMALEALAATTTHCAAVVNMALRSSDTSLLLSRRVLTAQLSRVKSRRADIPNPEIPVRIQLAKDNLPELLNMLSSVGAIVVDGKMEGGTANTSGTSGTGTAGTGTGGTGAGAQGPYHPPNSNASAVVALQHVAMHQTYANNMNAMGNVGNMGNMAMGTMGNMGNMAAGYLSALQRRTTHHVTSTTHPHHLHGMTELNLRGLLNQNSVSAMANCRPPRHQMYQHMMNAYAQNAYSGAQAQPQAQGPVPQGHQSGGHQSQGGGHVPRRAAVSPATWHVPQHRAGPSPGGFETPTMGYQANVPAPGTPTGDYKITLNRQHSTPSVTSTNPKTPSPSLSGAPTELDKVCAASVQELLATIAKLDSNGVQVLREHQSPPVHSSTSPDKDKSIPTESVPAADPNEDWCAVCLDGGELVCCDKCPKVFHQYCHIPTIDTLPMETETWQCLLCVNFAELPPSEDPGSPDALSPRLQKIVERITLELYCQYELSLALREPAPGREIGLDAIRARLQPSNPHRYVLVTQFLADCRTLFNCAYASNPVDSQLYKDARRLEEFFNSIVAKLLPDHSTWANNSAQNHAPTHNHTPSHISPAHIAPTHMAPTHPLHQPPSKRPRVE